WIPPARLEEQLAMLPAKVGRRVWLNEDITEAGDFLEEEDIQAALSPPIRPLTTRYVERRDRDSEELSQLVFSAGLDLSTRINHSALVVVGANPLTKRIRVAEVQHWAPKGRDIDL